jgi:hypothetical protein
MRLKLRELALRLSKPWTKRRLAAGPLHGNAIAWLRVGKTGAILTCLTSLSKSDLCSKGLCCKALLPRQKGGETPCPLLLRLDEWDDPDHR